MGDVIEQSPAWEWVTCRQCGEILRWGIDSPDEDICKKCEEQS